MEYIENNLSEILKDLWELLILHNVDGVYVGNITEAFDMLTAILYDPSVSNRVSTTIRLIVQSYDYGFFNNDDPLKCIPPNLKNPNVLNIYKKYDMWLDDDETLGVS